ncbi:hypothetical protein GGI15_004495 [Coemansia interrupta]|uniref:Amino acid transporter transmembrane domain-containing protein n=1 Tax=Coemansia interrupta TaxID=1126814 RepID=A0A9W8H2W0_9FUNG|nr:hypothetical protein GGI15_004495 [Coemansia interrupta]
MSTHTPPPGGNLSPLGAGLNLVNTIIGSGILALPYALKEAGFFFGILVLVAVALLSNFALNTLVYSGRRSSQYKYEAVSSTALGPLGHYLLAFGLAVNSIGSCITYLIIIGDLGAALSGVTFGSGWWSSRQFVILVSACGLTLPLLFFRTLEPLVRPSALSTLCMPAIVAIVALRGPAYALPEPVPTPVFGPSVLPAFGVISFAYSCTQTCYQSYQTLQKKTLDGWAWATRFATTTALVIYLAFSILSYRSFGLDTQPNLLNNFAQDDALANVARALLAFSLTWTYPMQFYPIRDLLCDSLGLDIDEAPKKFHLVSLALFTSTLVAALTIDDLGFVFKIIGTAASSLLVFGLPGIIYLKLASPYTLRGKAATEESDPLLLLPVPASASGEADDRKQISEPSTSLVSVVLLVLGAGVFVIGTWSAVQEYVSA